MILQSLIKPAPDQGDCRNGSPHLQREGRRGGGGTRHVHVYQGRRRAEQSPGHTSTITCQSSPVRVGEFTLALLRPPVPESHSNSDDTGKLGCPHSIHTQAQSLHGRPCIKRISRILLPKYDFLCTEQVPLDAAHCPESVSETFRRHSSKGHFLQLPSHFPSAVNLLWRP